MAEIWESWGHYAYLGSFIWAFFEGETFVLAAAALGAATGAVNPWWLLFAVWFGSFLGDQTWFTLHGDYIGRSALFVSLLLIVYTFTRLIQGKTASKKEI